MNTGKIYKTRQKEEILSCIQENAESYITIQQISKKMELKNEKVGLTTIYRNLDKLESEGTIARVRIEGVKGTCYRYLPKTQEDIFFSLKCEKCGKMIHIDCPELFHLYEHVSKEHHIDINPGKTMFYGICEQCKY